MTPARQLVTTAALVLALTMGSTGAQESLDTRIDGLVQAEMQRQHVPGPIEEPRLEAMPWTPYCLKHAQRLEVAASPRTPTL